METNNKYPSWLTPRVIALCSDVYDEAYKDGYEKGHNAFRDEAIKWIKAHMADWGYEDSLQLIQFLNLTNEDF
jgi:hypothetical protein